MGFCWSSIIAVRLHGGIAHYAILVFVSGDAAHRRVVVSQKTAYWSAVSRKKVVRQPSLKLMSARGRRGCHTEGGNAIHRTTLCLSYARWRTIVPTCSLTAISCSSEGRRSDSCNRNSPRCGDVHLASHSDPHSAAHESFARQLSTCGWSRVGGTAGTTRQTCSTFATTPTLTEQTKYHPRFFFRHTAPVSAVPHLQ